MKAVLFDRPGDPGVLHIGEAPDPVPGPEDLLVRVRAAGINRADTAQRRGNYPPPAGASPILGLELAGEVIAPVGPWKAGDRLMAVVTGGGYAELAVVPLGVAMRVPDNLTFEQAAAIPEAFLTGYLNLFTLGHLEAGEIALIHAGASGVGTAAIQLARVAGARVFVTASSEEKLASCRSLGAELAINYKDESFVSRVLEATEKRGVDVILDFVGAPYWDGNLAVLARGGRLMLIGFLGGSAGHMDLGPLMTKNLTVTGTTLRRTSLPHKAALVEAFTGFALPRFERGELVPVLDTTYPLDQAAEAHRFMESNRNIGKIVLRLDYTRRVLMPPSVPP